MKIGWIYTLRRIDIAGGPDQTTAMNVTQAADGITKEAKLDFQTILGMTFPMPVTSWSTGVHHLRLVMPQPERILEMSHIWFGSTTSWLSGPNYTHMLSLLYSKV
jgi:hypothetical protein